MMLLDTSGLFAFLDGRDHNHATAKRILNLAHLRITHSYILAELVALASARHLHRTAILDFLEIVVRSPDFDVEWVTAADHQEGIALLRARPDKLYSLCDAISFN